MATSDLPPLTPMPAAEEGSNRIYTCLPDLTVSYTPFTANILFGGSEYDAACELI